MADVNPNVAQVVDPELQADLTRLLQIRGPLGVLNVLDTIVPIVSLGNVVTPDINIRGPVFRSTDIFSNGLLVAQPVNAVLADTGSLPAGTYDVVISSETSVSSSGPPITHVIIEHRDAANAASLAVWRYIIRAPDSSILIPFSFSYELAVNERLRMLQGVVAPAANTWNGLIFARIR